MKKMNKKDKFDDMDILLQWEGENNEWMKKVENGEIKVEKAVYKKGEKNEKF